MSNNIFNGRRFLLLCRQHFVHNTNFLLLSTVAYIGVVFIVLSVVQVGNNLYPHDTEIFQGCLVGFVMVFGILYVGHAFPAFRSKESTINYLMLPASVLEKFVFEFIIRIGIIIPALPLLYWVTFHLQGYFFAIFTDKVFEPIGIQYLVKINVDESDRLLVYTFVAAGGLLALVLAFTGASIFTKQPLVKTLFAVALIIMFFFGYSFIVLTYLEVENYNPPDAMFFLPRGESEIFRLITIGLIAAIFVMLFVAFRKLKEREV